MNLLDLLVDVANKLLILLKGHERLCPLQNLCFPLVIHGDLSSQGILKKPELEADFIVLPLLLRNLPRNQAHLGPSYKKKKRNKRGIKRVVWRAYVFLPYEPEITEFGFEPLLDTLIVIGGKGCGFG